MIARRLPSPVMGVVVSHISASHGGSILSPGPGTWSSSHQRCRTRCQHIQSNCSFNANLHPKSFNIRLFSTAKSPKATLRKHIRPFLVACHPDASHFSDEDDTTEGDSNETKKKHMSRQAKVVNLKAVQTLNGLIDICDELITRCITNGVGQIPELKSQYEVEFMLPSNHTNERTGELKIRGKFRRQEISLRSVVISFPAGLREEVRQSALSSSSSSEEGYYTGMRLKKHTEKELMRLLTVAGLEHEGPVDVNNEDGYIADNSGQERKQEERWTLSDHFLHELGIEPMEDIGSQSSAFYGRNRSKASPPGYSMVREEREAFVKSIRWDKFRDKYDAAYEDAKANDLTDRMNLYNPNTKEGRERRERLVSEICSRVEIWMGGDETNAEDIPEGLGVVAQLVAIRRLSSILLENFEYLNMEKMGRMWENLVIVLTPPRDGRRRHLLIKKHNPDDEYADFTRKHSPHPGRKLNKWERRMKKRERATPPTRGYMRKVADYHYNSTPKQINEDINNDTNEHDPNSREQSTIHSSPSQISESGFKFSYGSQQDQGTGQVTAYVPIDFGDDEVVRQLHVYLYDYFDNCCSDMGFLKVGADGNLTANVAGLDEDELDGKRATN